MSWGLIVQSQVHFTFRPSFSTPGDIGLWPGTWAGLYLFKPTPVTSFLQPDPPTKGSAASSSSLPAADQVLAHINCSLEGLKKRLKHQPTPCFSFLAALTDVVRNLVLSVTFLPLPILLGNSLGQREALIKTEGLCSEYSITAQRSAGLKSACGNHLQDFLFPLLPPLLLCFVFRFLLCNFGWPGIHFVEEAVLEPKEIFLSLFLPSDCYFRFFETVSHTSHSILKFQLCSLGRSRDLPPTASQILRLQ